MSKQLKGPPHPRIYRVKTAPDAQQAGADEEAKVATGKTKEDKKGKEESKKDETSSKTKKEDQPKKGEQSKKSDA